MEKKQKQKPQTKPTAKKGLSALKENSEVNYMISKADVEEYPSINGVKVHRAFIKTIDGSKADLIIKQAGGGGETEIVLKDRKYSENKEDSTFHCVE